MIKFAPMSEAMLTYDEAVMYCFLCTHNGHRDWRMPTRQEYFDHAECVGWYLTENHVGRRLNHVYHATPVRG